MIASYREADSEKDTSIKKEKITEIEEYLSKQNPKKNLSEEKNSDDSSDELYNQTFSAHIIKLDFNNSKANTQSNSNDNINNFQFITWRGMYTEGSATGDKPFW